MHRATISLTYAPYVRSRGRLERDIVVHFVESAAFLALRFRTSLGRGRRLARHRFGAAAAPPQKLHALRADLSRVAVLPILVLPLARLQPALDVDRGTFFQVFARDLGQPAEECDAMPLGMLLL